MRVQDKIREFIDDIQEAMDEQANGFRHADAFLYSGEELRELGVGAVRMLTMDGRTEGWLSTETFQFHS